MTKKRKNSSIETLKAKQQKELYKNKEHVEHTFKITYHSKYCSIF